MNIHKNARLTPYMRVRIVERFNSEWWHGPIPTPETVLRVSLVGYERRYRVTVERVLV